LIGTILRVRYEITRELEETPLFRLFIAHDQVQPRDVTVRLLKAPFYQDPGFRDKLVEVVAKVSRVSHPNIERLIEVDDEEGQPFIVGDMVRGTPLRERIKKLVTFSVPVAVGTAISIAEALEAIHSHGAIHGDVGAHTVTVSTDGSVKVQAAGLWEAYSSSAIAGAMVLPLMAPYLAPEISAGGEPSVQSDLYALGIVLYEMITGRQPYVAETSVALAMKHSTAPTPSARLFNPAVPPVLDEIVKKAMEKDPAQRYASAAEFLADLRILQDALRFGKNLTWPLRKAQSPDSAVPQPSQAKAEGKPKNAIRVEVKPTREPVYDDEPPSDVPGWLKLIIAFFAAMVVCMLGIWIFFTNFSSPKEITVPNILKMPLADAEKELQKLGLQLKISREQASEVYPADTVIDSNPAPGQHAREGGDVNVVISSGTRFVGVPDLRGLTVEQARDALEKIKLVLDEKVRYARDRNVPVGVIIKQSLDPTSKVERGTKIWITVSAGRDYRDEPDRSIYERYAYTLKIKTTGLEDPVMVRVVMTDAQGVKTVHEAEHYPGDEFDVTAEGYGKEVTFRIFYDGVLVKQVTQQPDRDTPEGQ
jgi:serine/threonine protein kinase